MSFFIYIRISGAILINLVEIDDSGCAHDKYIKRKYFRQLTNSFQNESNCFRREKFIGFEEH